jgi:hypothetical protein
VTVGKGSQTTQPTLTTAPSATSVTLATTAPTLKDSATLSGAYDPTGTVTFTLYGPSNNLLDTETVTVSGNGTYTTPTGYTLPGTSVQVAGMYQWDATYSGDGNNKVASDNNDPGEVVTVTAPGQLAFGSGWYTIPGVGKTSFGFVVAQVPKNTYWGQLNLVTPGKWWFQANVTSYGKTRSTQGLLGGTGSLYLWNSTLNKGHGGWQLVASGVTYKATANAATRTTPASFGINIARTPTSGQPALPNSSPIALSSGGIFIT